MSILICGDVHGKTEIMYSLYQLAVEPDITKIVFVGDFVDGYGTSIEDETECMNLALDLSERGLATLIYGNHELSYLNPRMRCSRYRLQMQYYFDANRPRIEKEFVQYAYVEDFLVTHAGLSSNHLKDVGAQSVEDYLNNYTYHFLDIGVARGGLERSGGIFWNDSKYEFSPIGGQKQVFGHTRTPLIVDMDNDNYCIDCLHETPSVLEIYQQNETVKVKTRTIGESSD